MFIRVNAGAELFVSTLPLAIEQLDTGYYRLFKCWRGNKIAHIPWYRLLTECKDFFESSDDGLVVRYFKELPVIHPYNSVSGKYLVPRRNYDLSWEKLPPDYRKSYVIQVPFRGGKDSEYPDDESLLPIFTEGTVNSINWVSFKQVRNMQSQIYNFPSALASVGAPDTFTIPWNKLTCLKYLSVDAAIMDAFMLGFSTKGSVFNLTELDAPLLSYHADCIAPDLTLNIELRNSPVERVLLPRIVKGGAFAFYDCPNLRYVEVPYGTSYVIIRGTKGAEICCYDRDTEVTLSDDIKVTYRALEDVLY